MKYFSQYLQDEFIDKIIFRKNQKGVFIEVGANDGISLSNTYFFEKFRNWDGICIEPLPQAFQKLTQNRSCIKINACISKEKSLKKFLLIKGPSEMLSGIINSYDEKHLNRINEEINKFGGEKEEITVNSTTLAEILRNYNIQNIDYCSIDVEGSELEVLQSIDFEKTKIIVFSIEDNYNNNLIQDFLIKHSYKLIGKLGADLIFIHNQHYKKIYSLMIVYYNIKSKIRLKLKQVFKFN